MDRDSRTLDLCCGGKKCPVLHEEDDGSVVIADAEQTAGAIRIRAGDVERVAHWLATRRTQRRSAQIELHSDAP